MNILLVGQGSVLLACAEVLRASGIVFSVIGPKETFVASFAGARMAALGIPVCTLCAAELFEHIRTAPKPILIFSIMNNVIFPPDIAEREDITIVNYHNAVLPGHRGRNCEAWQIYHQEEYAGVTWHYVDAGVDTGAVIRHSAIPISPDMTSIRLLAMQGREAVRLFREVFPLLLSQERRKREEREVPAPSLLHFSWEKPNNGVLDPAWKADEVWAFLRAMDYGCLHTLGIPVLEWGGTRYTWRSYIGEGMLQGHAEAGICLTGSVMTFLYPAGRIVLRECIPVEQNPEGMKMP